MMMARFQAEGKYPIRRHLFIMRVRAKIALSHMFLRAALEIASSLGALRFGSLWMIFYTVHEEVKKMLVKETFLIVRTLFRTSGRSSPVIEKNWLSNVSANISAFSSDE